VLNSENVHRGKHIAKSEYFQRLYNSLLDTIAELLRSAIDKSLFRTDCEAQNLCISLSRSRGAIGFCRESIAAAIIENEKNVAPNHAKAQPCCVHRLRVPRLEFYEGAGVVSEVPTPRGLATSRKGVLH
jgi:Tetracyclin repressor-like, C-terminal domain